MIRTYLARLWCSLNYRYCMSNAYLASQRHEIIEAVWWAQQANTWQDKWRTAR